MTNGTSPREKTRERLPDVPCVRDRRAAVAEQDLGQRRAEHGQHQRRGRHDTDDSRTLAEKSSRTRPNCPSAACALIRGSSAVITGYADDRVRHLEQLPRVAVVVSQTRCRGTLHRGRVGQPRGDEERHLRGHDVAEHPARHPADLGHLGPAEVEPRPPPEPHPAQRRHQRDGLHDDAQRRADAQQQDPAGEIVAGGLVQPDGDA